MSDQSSQFPSSQNCPDMTIVWSTSQALRAIVHSFEFNIALPAQVESQHGVGLTPVIASQYQCYQPLHIVRASTHLQISCYFHHIILVVFHHNYCAHHACSSTLHSLTNAILILFPCFTTRGKTHYYSNRGIQCATKEKPRTQG